MWTNKSIEEIIKKFDTDPINGLSTEEVEKRKEKYGLNKFKSKKQKKLIVLFFEQLNNILIFILIAAAFVSAFLGELSDSIIIAIVILINAIVGMIQEAKAEKALEELKKLSTPKTIVKRDGEIKEIPSEEVVPGDIIVIDAGRYIPCDLRLIESINLQIEESALTGESIPSDKEANVISDNTDTPLGDQNNMAFMSTLVTYGRGIGIAVETGMNTEVGKIAEMLESSEKEQTPLQKKLDKFGKFLGAIILILCASIFFISIGEQYIITGTIEKNNVLEMLLVSISLAVAAIPEGLPAIVTIVLAIGVQKMIEENAIIRKLPAIETLGSVNIICSDKTGTLTQNKMTVTKFYCDNTFADLKELNSSNPSHKLLLENVILCNDATYSEDSQTGDPTEIALIEAGEKHNIFKNQIDEIHPRINEAPFDSDRKLMSTINKYDNKYYVMTKGAIDNILKVATKTLVNGKIVPLTNDIKDNIMKASNSMSDEALRVLGAAYKVIDSPHIDMNTLESDLIFIGLLGMIDPPRLEVKDSIALCKEAGIETIMITGDHKNTAIAIAKELGIASDLSQAISGTELNKLSKEELDERINDLKVFARVSPEHKVTIVNSFKSKGNIVSMTGDGVNDAPSLKAADIGVSMGITGTDVAKGASDMILTDDNFSTIVKAIEKGRNIYNNIKKSILFLLSCNMGEIISIFIAILMGWPTPLKPIHILWINLITDTLPALSLGADADDPTVMNEKPRDSKEGLFTNSEKRNVILNGLLIGFLTLTAYVLGARIYTGTTSLFPLFPKNITQNALVHAQTMAFIVLSVSQLFHSLNMRHPNKSIFQLGLFTNKYLIASIILGIFLQNIVITVPFLTSVFKVSRLEMKNWLLVGLLSIMPLIINEIVKIFKRNFK